MTTTWNYDRPQLFVQKNRYKALFQVFCKHRIIIQKWARVDATQAHDGIFDTACHGGDMAKLSPLLSFCESNPLPTCGYPSRRSKDAGLRYFFVVSLKKLSDKPWSYRFETPWPLFEVIVLCSVVGILNRKLTCSALLKMELSWYQLCSYRRQLQRQLPVTPATTKLASRQLSVSSVRVTR